MEITNRKIITDYDSKTCKIVQGINFNGDEKDFVNKISELQKENKNIENLLIENIEIVAIGLIADITYSSAEFIFRQYATKTKLSINFNRFVNDVRDTSIMYEFYRSLKNKKLSGEPLLCNYNVLQNELKKDLNTTHLICYIINKNLIENKDILNKNIFNDFYK